MRGGSVAVVGGSTAGCAAALAASRGGAERVTVLERADARLRDRGVGIALHGDRYDELREAGYVAGCGGPPPTSAVARSASRPGSGVGPGWSGWR